MRLRKGKLNRAKENPTYNYTIKLIIYDMQNIKVIKRLTKI